KTAFYIFDITPAYSDLISSSQLVSNTIMKNFYYKRDLINNFNQLSNSTLKRSTVTLDQATAAPECTHSNLSTTMNTG
ncbi:MAG: hypothetical protein ACOCRB_02565, partial [Halanaerobiaceae bacterium]